MWLLQVLLDLPEASVYQSLRVLDRLRQGRLQVARRLGWGLVSPQPLNQALVDEALQAALPLRPVARADAAVDGAADVDLAVDLDAEILPLAVLYRIVGNDLYPRHGVGQGLANLRFILQHEPLRVECPRCWILNRIVDSVYRDQLLQLLQDHGESAVVIPFDPQHYRALGWTLPRLTSGRGHWLKAYARLDLQRRDTLQQVFYRDKNAYLMNNNGARNTALALGKQRARWVLPWDGNCFLTDEAWEQLRLQLLVADRQGQDLVAIPMERLHDNSQVLDSSRPPAPRDEPQLAFSRGSGELFHPHYVYGRRPKVELLWRLGLPGPWDAWYDEPWDVPRRPRRPGAPPPLAGWVARLFSGTPPLNGRSVDVLAGAMRFERRNLAIKATLNLMNSSLLPPAPRSTVEIPRQSAALPLAWRGKGLAPLALLAHRCASLAAGWPRGRAMPLGLEALLRELFIDPQTALPPAVRWCRFSPRLPGLERRCPALEELSSLGLLWLSLPPSSLFESPLAGILERWCHGLALHHLQSFPARRLGPQAWSRSLHQEYQLLATGTWLEHPTQGPDAFVRVVARLADRDPAPLPADQLQLLWLMELIARQKGWLDGRSAELLQEHLTPGLRRLLETIASARPMPSDLSMLLAHWLPSLRRAGRLPGLPASQGAASDWAGVPEPVPIPLDGSIRLDGLLLTTSVLNHLGA